jgi:dTDP-4-dehydrorhamnose 3,5-epimerase
MMASDCEIEMKFKESSIAGAFIVDVKKIEDARGYFGRAFCRKEFESHGIDFDIQQANIGFSQSRGTLRGLHFQVFPHEEAKLVRCAAGALFDVILDLRSQSPTFEKWAGVELSSANGRMVYVPKGCAHGYLTLVDNTQIYYLVNEFYHQAAECGIRWDDPAFDIDWPYKEGLVISQKDQNWPDWKA